MTYLSGNLTIPQIHMENNTKKREHKTIQLEAATGGVLLKELLKLSQHSQENSCVGVSIKPATLFKRDSNTSLSV